MVDAAANRLREAILRGEMAPGDPIRVRSIEQRLGISHIPIREALRRLEAEGLIVSPPRRTSTVAGVALEDLSAIYEIRRMIEIPTARLSLQTATAADEVKVRHAFEAFERAASDTVASEFWERHREFHWALLEPGANPWTRRTLEPLWGASERYVRLFVSTFGSTESAMGLHRRVLEAFEGGDPDMFANAMLDDFAESERVISEGYLATMASRSAARETGAA